jgi:beta-lactamase class A
MRTLLALCLTALPLTAAEPSFAEKITPLAKAHKGQITLAVKHLDTGETFVLDADKVMPTASLIKLAVMAEAYYQTDEKKLDLAKMVTLTKEDKVPGAGILTQHFSDGVTLAVKDCIRLMMVYSDNTATNLVLDQVGIKNVNDRMEKLGLKDTKINAKVFKGSTTSVNPDRTKQYGLGSTTAAETVKLLELIHTNKLVNAEACKTMLAHMKLNDDKEMLVRLLPEGTVVAHKTGAVNAARTDAGILYVPVAGDKKKTHAVAVCVLTNDNEDRRWILENAAQVTIAKIGKAVYDHYAASK